MTAELTTAKISVKGRMKDVPCLRIDDKSIVVEGKWLKTASVKDEAWLVNNPVTNPAAMIEIIRDKGLVADIFTFAQRLPETEPKFDYTYLLDNFASIPLSDYGDWWEKRLPQETRKNVRRSAKRGVVIREVEFSDELVESIVKINNESPMRQGRPYWHYGKSFEVVKRDYATLLDHSIFLGAYFEGELIGFIKLVCMSDIAAILQIVCMNKHQDKRAASALIAKAVEICCDKQYKHLTYGKYIYGNNSQSPLTEFKRRNGFEQIDYPRYHVPLSTKGQFAMALGLHLSFKRFVPEKTHARLRELAARWNNRALSKSNSHQESAESTSD